MTRSDGDPELLVFERDGRRLTALEWGGEGSALLLLHPNGFCGGVFHPIARRLVGRYRSIAIDLGGHGASDAPTEYSFRALAEDVAFCLDTLGVDAAFAVGASLGGGVAIQLNVLRPGLLRHVVLAEAVAFDQENEVRGPNTFAEQARRRRVNWPSRDAVAHSYSSRPPLDALDPEALWAYLRWGVVDEADGSVSLACKPAVEAALFEIARTPEGGAGTWDLLPHLRGRATVIAGSRSNIDTRRFARQAQVLDTTMVLVDAGHLVLYEDTDRAVSLVVDKLEHASTY